MKILRSEIHGGRFARGRKTRRPLALRCPIHLVLKARRSLWSERNFLYERSPELARRFGVDLLGTAVEHDHFHLVLSTPDRKPFQSFLRLLSAEAAARLGPKLWKQLPFTRIADWDQLDALLGYLQKNRDEAEGRQPYQPRVDRYAHLR